MNTQLSGNEYAANKQFSKAAFSWNANWDSRVFMEKRAYSWKKARVHGKMRVFMENQCEYTVYLANTQLSGNEHREYTVKRQ